jgi:hypothetical protein
MVSRKGEEQAYTSATQKIGEFKQRFPTGCRMPFRR